jgi:hypothetical protein
LTQLVLSDGNTIYDALLQSYGIDYAYKLIQENNIDSIDVDLLSQQLINFDELFQIPIVPDVAQVSGSTPSPIKSRTGYEGQSIYDLCQMSYGSLDLIYKLIQESQIDSIDQSDFYRISVTYDENFITDKFYYSKVIKAGTVINTSSSGTVKVLGLEDGQVYFGTEDGFLIQIE